MKKLIASLVFILLFLINAEAKKIEGWIIRGNDTLEVTLRIPTGMFGGDINYQALQRKIRYIDENGKKRHFKPHQVDEVVFEYYGEEIRMFSHRTPTQAFNLFAMSSHVLMKLDIEGELRLFTYFSDDVINDPDDWYIGDNRKETYYLQKGNDELKSPRFFKFRKDMISYLSDCEVMVEKLKEKDFRRWNLWEMVRFYNRQCF